MTATASAPYAARLEIDYADRNLDRLSSFFRLFYLIPIGIILSLIGSSTLFFPTLLMILFRKKYPRWWFDFSLELTRLSTRVGSPFK